MAKEESRTVFTLSGLAIIEAMSKSEHNAVVKARDKMGMSIIPINIFKKGVSVRKTYPKKSGRKKVDIFSPDYTGPV